MKDINDMYNYCKKEFDKLPFLYHFTTFDSLKKIIDSRSFRLTKITSNSLNDRYEKESLSDIWKEKTYIFCMTDKMSDYYWNEYAKGKKTGVCIKIDNKNFWYRNIKDDRGSYLKHKNDKIIDLDWIIYSLDGLMIIYDNVEKYSIEDEKFKNFFSECKNLCEEKKRDLYRVKHCQGYLKSSDWGVKEKEYRIRAVIKNKCKFEINGEYKNPPYEYIFIDFSNFIDNISVGFCREFIYKKELIEICKSSNIKYFEIVDN